jgi:hypothetical protein
LKDSEESLLRNLAPDLTLAFLAAVALILPWFAAGYLNLWGSIESAFIADARFLMNHWPHPRWQPLWYAGCRFHRPPPLISTAVLRPRNKSWRM